MAIRIKYDAAAVVPPSNETTRKYGQNLVQQQRQQNFLGQQQGYDRMFQLGRDAIQSRDQAIRQGQQNAFQTTRDVNQNASLMERQEAQNKFLSEQQQREQQAKDFAAAKDRIGGYAQDALKNPDLPPELRQKIRDLMSAKAVALGSGFNAVQQQEFLDQYNAQLAAILSEVPPPKPKAPPQPNFHTDPNGNKWVESGPGKWEQVPQQAKTPTTAEEAFKADPKTEAKFMEEAKTIIGKGKPLDEAGYYRAVELARKLWERSQLPSEFGGKGSTSSASYYNAPDSGVPAAPPAGIPVAPPDAGVPPSPPMPGEQQAAPPSVSQAESDAQMKAQGYELVTPANGGKPYYYKVDSTPQTTDFYSNDTTGAQSQAPKQAAPQAAAPGVPPDVSAKVDAFVAGEPTPDQPTPEFAAAQKQLENNGMKVPGTSSSKPPAAPDFGALASSATDSADRAVIGKLQGIYESQTPEVQNAISVFVRPGVTKQQRALALRAIRDAGIDLEPEPSVKEKTQETMREKYGESYDSF